MQHAEACLGTEQYFDLSIGQLSIGQPAARELHDVVASHLPILHRSAYRLLGNAADAEDAVQDALLSACKHFDQFRGESQISTWLTAIVFNSARMRLRLRSRQGHVSLDEPIGDDYQYSLSERLACPGLNPEEEYRRGELTGHVRQLMARLSPAQARIFQLRAIEGRSIRETSELLGVPAGTVKAQLTRARKKLKRWLPRALQP